MVLDRRADRPRMGGEQERRELADARVERELAAHAGPGREVLGRRGRPRTVRRRGALRRRPPRSPHPLRAAPAAAAAPPASTCLRVSATRATIAPRRPGRRPSRRCATARYGKRSAASRVATPVSTRIVCSPASRPDDDVGVHPVADHRRRLRVGLDRVQRRAHHQRVRLADVVGLDAGRAADQRRDRAGRRQRAVGRRAGRVGVRGDEARAGGDEADRLRDALEAVGPRLAEHDVVRVALGQRVARPRAARWSGRPRR